MPTPAVEVYQTLLPKPVICARIQIPASTDLGTTVDALLASAGISGARYVEISGLMADGTTVRPGIRLTSKRPGADVAQPQDYTIHGHTKVDGEHVTLPPTTDFSSILIRRASGPAFFAQFLVLA